jgi:hypothetical protein
MRKLIANISLVEAYAAGLPDGIFSNQKSQFWYIFGAIEWKMLVYFMAIWNNFTVILRSFRNVVVIWYIFQHFGILHEEKSGNPATRLLQACIFAVPFVNFRPTASA